MDNHQAGSKKKNSGERRYYRALRPQKREFQTGQGDYVFVSDAVSGEERVMRIAGKKHPFEGKKIRDRVSLRGQEQVVTRIIKAGTKEFFEFRLAHPEV